MNESKTAELFDNVNDVKTLSDKDNAIHNISNNSLHSNSLHSLNSTFNNENNNNANLHNINKMNTINNIKQQFSSELIDKSSQEFDKLCKEYIDTLYHGTTG